MNFSGNDGHDRLSPDNFAESQGAEYLIYFDETKPLKAVLIEFSLLGKERDNGFQPFALLFETDQQEAFYMQGTYRLTLKKSADFDYHIFLVPIGFGGESGKARYEAVFN